MGMGNFSMKTHASRNQHRCRRYSTAMIKESTPAGVGNSDAKAYDVPGLCRRLNLADGEQEAFSSKYNMRRSDLSRSGRTGRRLPPTAAEEQHFELSGAIGQD